MNNSFHNFSRHKLLIIVTIIILVLVVITAVDARQFRSIQTIASPVEQEKLEAREGVIIVEDIHPLTVKQVEPAVRELFASWNTNQLMQLMGENFYDSDRVLDAIDTQAPRDAKLRLQSIESLQTLQQYIEPDTDNPGRKQLVSKVTLTARTQLEFQTAQGQFVRRPGRNEYLLNIIFPEQSGNR